MAANEGTNKQGNLFPITKRVVNGKLQLEFYEIAQKARLIPNLPQPIDKTIEQVAEYLEELCVELTHKNEVWTGPRQAAWLMNEIIIVSPWEKWAGPAGLKRVHSTKFSPEFDTYKSPEPVSGYRCQKCRDNSSVIVDGHHRRCDCDGARQLQGKVPDWIELLEDSSARSQKPRSNRSRFSDSRNIRKLLSRV
jgi:hypothetical protein